MRKLLLTIPFAVAAALAAGQAPAQVAGSSQIGVTTIELKDVINGWSARKQILGQHVYNDKGEQVGTIEDIIISPEKSASYAIVGAGGFLGLGAHDVAIPASQLTMKDKRFILPGATKETIRAMPAFEYSRR
jgi:sporulation protein YlmC with PRC-barrel domain